MRTSSFLLFVFLTSQPFAHAKDQGFRFDATSRSCLNPTTHAAGLNAKEMMECGDLRTIDFKDLLSYMDPAAQKRPDLLAGKELTGANGSGVDFHNFSFVGATLDNADFSNADLRGAVLRSAEVTATNFTGAKFNDATVLPEGWTKDTATRRGMTYVSAEAPPTPPAEKNSRVEDAGPDGSKRVVTPAPAAPAAPTGEPEARPTR